VVPGDHPAPITSSAVFQRQQQKLPDAQPGVTSWVFDAFMVALPSLPVPPVDGTGKGGLATGKVTRLSSAGSWRRPAAADRR
jgi:hypothetical protein